MYLKGGEDMLFSYRFGDFYLRHAIDEAPEDKDFTMHIHDVCEIYFFISGDVKYLVEGSEYMLDEGSLMIMRPSEAHKPKILSSKKYERFSINFPLSFAEEIDPMGNLTSMFADKTLGKRNMFSPSDIDIKLIKSLFSQMCEECSEYERRLTINTHLLFILDMLMRAYPKNEIYEYSTPSVTVRMVNYVNDHLFDDISIPDISRHFFLSPSQFSRVFKQATGATPWEYITKKRLTAVKERISTGAHANRAAQECGFGDYSSFYRAYVNHFGSSPTADARSAKAK